MRGEEVLGRAPSPALAPPPGNPRFPLFDGLRGLAVLGILAFHVWETTGRLGFGFVGRVAEVAGSEAVIAFFVISGFLLYRPFVAARADGRRGPSVRRFGRRRALRILPGYWTMLTLLAIFPGVVGVFSGDWWRYYGYLQLYWKRTVTGGIPVAWTLCVEVTFYLLLPVWAAAIRRIRTGPAGRGLLRAELWPLAAVAAAGYTVQIVAARQLLPYTVGISLAGQCAWIMIGMALAVASVAVQRDRSALGVLRRVADHPQLCWLGAAGAYLGLVALVPGGGLFGLIAAVQTQQPLPQTLAKLALEALLAALFVLPAVFGDPRLGLPRRLLGWRPVVWLGVISYSFYLWHFTLIQLLALDRAPGSFSAGGLDLLAHLHFARSPLLFLASLLAVGLLASVSYRFVELPFLRRKER